MIYSHGIGWHFEGSVALTRGPNPLRPALQSDVDAFLANGGQISRPQGGELLQAEILPSAKGAMVRRWVRAPAGAIGFNNRRPRPAA